MFGPRQLIIAVAALREDQQTAFRAQGGGVLKKFRQRGHCPRGDGVARITKLTPAGVLRSLREHIDVPKLERGRYFLQQVRPLLKWLNQDEVGVLEYAGHHEAGETSAASDIRHGAWHPP